MQRILFTSIALAVLAGCSSTQQVSQENQAAESSKVAAANTQTLTQQDRKQAKQDTRGHRAMPMTQARLTWVLNEYNANQDQQLTWAEYNDWRLARFNKTDANDNGTVDAEEYVYEYENRLDARYEQGRQAHVKQTARRFAALDKNKNNRIEWSEYAASGDRIFTRWDTNQDGTINEADPQEKKVSEPRNSRFSNNPISFIRMPTTHTMKGLLSIYDANDDKAVTADEFTNERRSVFYLADSNKDGVLSSQEYLAEFEDRIDQTINTNRRAQIKQTYVRFAALDDNKDKKMTFDEFQLSGKRIFTRWDKNEDGVISNADVGK